CVAMAAWLDPVRAPPFLDYRTDVRSVRDWNCGARLDNRVWINRYSQLWELVCCRGLPFSACADGGSAFVAFSGANGRAIGTHRAVLGDLPSSRAGICAIF